MSIESTVIALDDMDEEQLEAELTRVKNKSWECQPGSEEDLKIEEEMRIVMTKLKAMKTIRYAAEDIAQQEEEERQEEIERSEKKKEEAEKQKKEREDRMGELEEKYLKAARMRYTAVYQNREYDQIVENCNFVGPMTTEIVLQLAQTLRKVENQKLTLARLIEKRERLDKEILEKTGGRGITDRDKLVAAYSVKELAKFLSDEMFDSDSETYKELESSDEEDMPRSRNVTDPEGIMDVQIEKPIAYISRLRKAALKGNVNLQAKYNALESKVMQLTKVQEEIQSAYTVRIKPIQREFSHRINELERQVRLAKAERDEIKYQISIGFKKSTEGQLISVEAEIEKVERAHKETLKKLEAELRHQHNEEIKSLKESSLRLESDDQDTIKRLRDLTLENKKLAAQLKKTPEGAHNFVSRKEYDEICKAKEESEELVMQLETDLEFAQLAEKKAEKTAELARELAEQSRKTAEQTAMNAQNRLNAALALKDEEFQRVKSELVLPLMEQVKSLGLFSQGLQDQRTAAQKEMHEAQDRLKAVNENTASMIKEAEKKGFEDARKKFTKQVANRSCQTEIAISPAKSSMEDVLDTASITFLSELGGVFEFDDKRPPFKSFRDYIKEFHYNEDGRDPDDEEFKELADDYAGYVHYYYLPKTREPATEAELLSYRQKRISNLVDSLKQKHDELQEKSIRVEENIKELAREKERYLRNESRSSKLSMDYSGLAGKLSNLTDEKYIRPIKFFSYPIGEWADKFDQAFGCSRFAYLDIQALSLEESKDLFTLLTEINRHTGSKSHIWYGNELNRRFNHRDSIKRPKNREGLIRRAQDTFLEWLNADAVLGLDDLESDLVTKNSICYAKLLNSIGNTTVKRAILTDNV